MNPQALHGPVRLSPKFQQLPCEERFPILMQISKTNATNGTIGIWKWYVKNDVLTITCTEK